MSIQYTVPGFELTSFWNTRPGLPPHHTYHRMNKSTFSALRLCYSRMRITENDKNNLSIRMACLS